MGKFFAGAILKLHFQFSYVHNFLIQFSKNSLSDLFLRCLSKL